MKGFWTILRITRNAADKRKILKYPKLNYTRLESERKRQE